MQPVNVGPSNPIPAKPMKIDQNGEKDIRLVDFLWEKSLGKEGKTAFFRPPNRNN
jgi:hypothetical protein